MGKIDRLKEIAADPRWLKFYFQRRFQNPAQRHKISGWLAKYRPHAEIIDQSAAREGAEILRDSGLYHLGEILSQQQCDELIEYFNNCKVSDPYNASAPKFNPLSGNRPKGAHVAHHNAQDIVNAPYLMDIANNPKVLDVVGGFLGCKPTIGYIATWWSYPTDEGPKQAENFHRDVDDWRFIKLFLYLTEVKQENGPHKYVLHSSTKPVLTQIRRLNDDEVSHSFGEENILTMTSQAGHAFLEDTYGVHKGQPLQSGNRLLFQVVYTLNPLPYGPKTPVKTVEKNSRFDAWTNRVYLK